jgi:hypothetical protein
VNRQQIVEYLMADNKKVVFIAFAIEDEWARNMLRGHSFHTTCPIEFVDYSVKEAYDSGWKDKVRTRIRRSDGVIAFVSKNSLKSDGQKWEIQCSKEEGKKIKGVWTSSDDRTTLSSIITIPWTWDGVAHFIDSL